MNNPYVNGGRISSDLAGSRRTPVPGRPGKGRKSPPTSPLFLSSPVIWRKILTAKAPGAFFYTDARKNSAGGSGGGCLAVVWFFGEAVV